MTDIRNHLVVNTLHLDQENNELVLDKTGRVQPHTARPPLRDPYSRIRDTCSFVLTNEATGVAVGADGIS